MSFKTYVAQRLLWTVFATFIIVSITFLLLAASPNAQVSQFAFEAAQNPGTSAEEAREAARQRLGTNQPLWERYTEYMINIFTLNWGYSQSGGGQLVTERILNALPYTALYSVPTTILSVIIGVSIGLYSATNQYSRFDYAATFFAFFGYAIPNFWFGIILLVIFGAWLGWVPIIFQPDVPWLSFEMLKQLILPVIVLVTAQTTGLMRYSRAEALEYVEAEFLKTAKAKGVSSYRIVTRHIFRPAAVPLMTILISDLLGLFIASSLLVEVVFSIPGLGRLTFNAILQQDTPLVLSTTLVGVMIAVFGNLLQDISYTVLDPRISYDSRE